MSAHKLFCIYSIVTPPIVFNCFPEREKWLHIPLNFVLDLDTVPRPRMNRAVQWRHNWCVYNCRKDEKILDFLDFPIFQKKPSLSFNWIHITFGHPIVMQVESHLPYFSFLISILRAWQIYNGRSMTFWMFWKYKRGEIWYLAVYPSEIEQISKCAEKICIHSPPGRMDVAWEQEKRKHLMFKSRNST